MPESSTHLVPIKPQTVRFEVRFALGQAPAFIWADLASKRPDRRQRALEALTGLVAQRFANFEVYGPPPIAAHGLPR